jgi:hypothetical protein
VNAQSFDDEHEAFAARYIFESFVVV